MKLTPREQRSTGLKLNPIKANMTEVEIGDKTVLFSYKTPVAYFDVELMTYYKTNKKWSRTTSKHINQWIPDNGEVRIEEVDQSVLDNLVG